MRSRDQVEKDYIDMKNGFMLKQQDRAVVMNPKLILEVLLDIRDLLQNKAK
jgi:hypothetical protein